MRKQRIDEIVLLRGMAFLAIALQHSIGEYIYRPDITQPDSIMLTMLFHFTRFGTPTFVFLSGLILFYNYYERLHYPSFIIKRFADIYAPFAVWTFVYYLFGQGFPTGTGWLNLAKELFIPSIGYHLWFVVMIFQFYLLFPVFIYMAKRVIPKLTVVKEEQVVNRVPAFVIVLAIAFGGLLWISYEVLPAWYNSTAPAWLKPFIAYRNLNFLFYSFYFVLGGVVAFGLEHWRKFIIRAFVWSAVVFTGMYIWMGYDVLSFSIEQINLNVSTYLKPTTFIIIVAQILLLYRVALLITDNGGLFFKLLRFIGTYSFGGFLIHPLIIWLLAMSTKLTGNHLSVTVIFYIAVVGISISSAYVLSKLPFGWLLVGTTGRMSSAQRRSKAGGVQPER